MLATKQLALLTDNMPSFNDLNFTILILMYTKHSFIGNYIYTKPLDLPYNSEIFDIPHQCHSVIHTLRRCCSFWSGSMSKCRRQAIFYNLSDFNCFKHVRATSLSFLPHPHTTSHICLSNSQCVCVCINVYKSVCNWVCECVCLASFLALSTLFHVEKIGEQEPGNSRQTLTSSLQTSWWPPLPPTYTPL